MRSVAEILPAPKACPTQAITFVDADWTGYSKMRDWAQRTDTSHRHRFKGVDIMGWHKKVLRVNLTDGSCNAEPLNMRWASEYLGQRGLATKYLLEEIDPQVDPLSPDNKLIFATGPLTGTMASTGGRFSVVTKGALTGAIACSNSGGYFGAELKFAGWDMVIFEGRALSPVYLLIKDDSVELLPADDLWGRSVWETDEILHRRHQDPQLRIAAIGQSGERVYCLPVWSTICTGPLVVPVSAL